MRCLSFALLLFVARGDVHVPVRVHTVGNANTPDAHVHSSREGKSHGKSGAEVQSYDKTKTEWKPVVSSQRDEWAAVGKAVQDWDDWDKKRRDDMARSAEQQRLVTSLESHRTADASSVVPTTAPSPTPSGPDPAGGASASVSPSTSPMAVTDAATLAGLLTRPADEVTVNHAGTPANPTGLRNDTSDGAAGLWSYDKMTTPKSALDMATVKASTESALDKKNAEPQGTKSSEPRAWSSTVAEAVMDNLQQWPDSDSHSPSSSPLPDQTTSVAPSPFPAAPTRAPGAAQSFTSLPKAGEDFIRNVCIAIPSTRRFAANGKEMAEPYIETLMNKLYGGLSEEAMADPSLFRVVINNVDQDPDQNLVPIHLKSKFQGVTILEPLVNNADRRASLEAAIPEEEVLEESVDDDGNVLKFPVSRSKLKWRIKEVMDTIDLLETCRASGRDFTLFLEDDVLPTSHLWAKLEEDAHAVKNMDPEFAFLTLYNPSNWEADLVEELHERREGILKYDYFCCTQSLLFETSRLEPILHSIWGSFNKLPVDHLLVEYVKVSNTTVYVSIPSLFQHVGAYSSLAERTMDPPEVAHESWTWQSLMQANPGVRIPAKSSRPVSKPVSRPRPEFHFSRSFIP